MITVSRREKNEIIQNICDELKISPPSTRTIKAQLQGKKFLLMLDDLWDPLSLEEDIGVPLSSNNSDGKVILAARDERVCSMMECRDVHKIKVDFLGKEDAWKLFRTSVGDDSISRHPEIPALARDIARECGGLPLALDVIGKAMRGAKTVAEWRHALRELKDSPSEDLFGVKDKLFSRLKYSYTALREDILKNCFLYCSLFPEDYSISVEVLTRCWSGEGYMVDDDDDFDSAFNRGCTVVELLKSASLLENGDQEGTTVKMHDVVRDLALWIKKEEFLVRPKCRLEEAPQDEAKWGGAEKSEFHTGRFFESMMALRVLDLSYTGLRELPASVCTLLGLRYLNLSSTYIEGLPEGFGALNELRYLNLSRMNRLNSTLGLENLKRLKALLLYISDPDVFRTVSDSVTLSRASQRLEIEECEGLERIRSSDLLNMKNSLREFTLTKVYDFEELEFPQLLMLQKLEVFSVPLLRMIKPVSEPGLCLPSLTDLKMYGCNELQDFAWVVHLPRLEHLELSRCLKLVKILGFNDVGINANAALFPALKTIVLCGLPMFESISDHALEFPALVEMKVKGCAGLKRLSMKLESVRKNKSLRAIRGEKEWWEGLEWEEIGLCSSLLQYFEVDNKRAF
ncbi:Disease resistance protein RPS2 [Acorus calamus]|uniref:Disease resistance protein RPS2 n=1 Tax=Acorus calamus TaxID=4465 RepID=A0AAV9BZ97_ACOCL|nr:Disease resistance protein RPS2 [Acorus calamus]